MSKLEDELREGGGPDDGCTCLQCRAANRISKLEAMLSRTAKQIQLSVGYRHLHDEIKVVLNEDGQNRARFY